MKRLHMAQAKAQGFTIDESAAGRPWAYKGSRFNPTSACECYTELETKLMALVLIVQEVITTRPGTPLARISEAALADLSESVKRDALDD